MFKYCRPGDQQLGVGRERGDEREKQGLRAECDLLRSNKFTKARTWTSHAALIQTVSLHERRGGMREEKVERSS